MKLLKVGDGKFVNVDRITYVEAKRRDKVVIQFQNEVSGGGIGIPPSYLVLRGGEAETFVMWLEQNTDKGF